MSVQIRALHVLIDFALLWAFCYFAWEPLAARILRCSLYRLRNQLFDMAANRSGGLSINGKVHRILRMHLTARIWHSCKLSSFHIYVTPVIFRLFGS